MGYQIRKESMTMRRIEAVVVVLCLAGLLLAECFITNPLTSRIVGGISATIGLLYVFISESNSKN